MGVKERIFFYIENKGITKSEFERKSGLSNGYLNNFKGALGQEKLNSILKAFPDLNKVWLLVGEGEMLIPSVIQTNENGDNINGQSVTVNKTETDKILDALNTCHELLRKKDEQLDRLISIIEKVTNNN